MQNIIFKKLDKETYLITNDNFCLNMYVRYSNVNKLYCVDIANRYFEETTITKVKERACSYIMSNKITEYLFEV